MWTGKYILKIEAVYSSETVTTIYQITRCLNPKSTVIFLAKFIKISVAWVRKRTILTERLPFVGEIVPTIADRGYHVVSVMDPYGRIFEFLDRSSHLHTNFNSRKQIFLIVEFCSTIASNFFFVRIMKFEKCSFSSLSVGIPERVGTLKCTWDFVTSPGGGSTSSHKTSPLAFQLHTSWTAYTSAVRRRNWGMVLARSLPCTAADTDDNIFVFPASNRPHPTQLLRQYIVF
jgi:hypothetical protein